MPFPISHRLLALAAACALAGSAFVAGATDLPVSFATLPSTQGWTFTTGGSPLATEAGTFSLSAGVLTLNTMAFGVVSPGTSAFYAYSGAVNNTEPLVIRCRARLVQHEGDFANTFVGGGFAFGFTQGTTLYQMGITPTQVRNAPGTVLSAVYDHTQFHDYRLEYTPPSSVRYFVDGALISTNNAGLAQALNRVLFGDVTGAANSKTEITEFRFLQGAAVPAVASTWGRVKSLYR